MNLGPQPGFQTHFGTCEADIAIGGGAAGAGKTWIELFEAAKATHVPGFNAIIFRRTSPEIRGQDGLWDKSLEIFPYFGGIPKQSTLEWVFPTSGRPSRVQFASMEHEQDRLKHQGRGYALIEWDELTHFTSKQFWYLLRSLRSACGVKPYVRATCNPDPDSFVRELIDWWIGPDGYPRMDRAGVLRWFVREGDELIWADTREELLSRFPDMPTNVPKSLTFIPGKLDDNKILMEKDPTYLPTLLALPYVDRMQQLNGNWNIRPAAGLYFRPDYFEIIDAYAIDDVMKTVRGWDKAGTEKKAGNDPAYTAGPKIHRMRSGIYVVEDCARFRESPGKTVERMRNTATQDGHGTAIWMWQDPGQAGKVDVTFTREKLAPFTVHVEVAKEDKITYAKPVSSAAEAGNIKLLRGEWNAAYIQEHSNFPDGKKKDQVDGTSLCIRKLMQARKITNKNPANRPRGWAWSDVEGGMDYSDERDFD